MNKKILIPALLLSFAFISLSVASAVNNDELNSKRNHLKAKFTEADKSLEIINSGIRAVQVRCLELQKRIDPLRIDKLELARKSCEALALPQLSAKRQELSNELDLLGRQLKELDRLLTEKK